VHIVYMKKVKTIGSNKDQQGPQKSITVACIQCCSTVSNPK